MALSRTVSPNWAPMGRDPRRNEDDRSFVRLDNPPEPCEKPDTSPLSRRAPSSPCIVKRAGEDGKHLEPPLPHEVLDYGGLRLDGVLVPVRPFIHVAF